MLNAITPVILTNNEAHNIGRTLGKLGWANDIVVVDSGSTDDTIRILEQTPRVRVFHRPLDSHCGQWRYATMETGISTPWILRLDADYQLSDGLIEELSNLDPGGAEAAYRIAFDYAIFSRKLVASLYPPNTILLKRGHFSIADAGHTEKWVVDGPIGALKSRIVHDDWKSMTDWLPRQVGYMSREMGKLETRRSGLRDWLRMHPPLMPIAVFFYCLFVKGLVFGGAAGLLYTFQRTIAESMLALLLLEKRVRSKTPENPARNRLS
jgi:glycosyltransferase involved in cell wall biosynthesis